ncbi:MAG: hypothetical protein WC942_07320 [Clostridia bacterium]|jgi:hypothetical protein
MHICFAKNIPGADIGKCCEGACKYPYWAYYFAKDIPGADIKKCQEGAGKHPRFAYMFARDIPGSNRGLYYANMFTKHT